MYGTYKYTNDYKGALTKNFHHTWILTIKHWRGVGGGGGVFLNLLKNENF